VKCGALFNQRHGVSGKRGTGGAGKGGKEKAVTGLEANLKLDKLQQGVAATLGTPSRLKQGKKGVPAVRCVKLNVRAQRGKMTLGEMVKVAVLTAETAQTVARMGNEEKKKKKDQPSGELNNRQNSRGKKGSRGEGGERFLGHGKKMIAQRRGG